MKIRDHYDSCYFCNPELIKEKEIEKLEPKDKLFKMWVTPELKERNEELEK